VREGARVTGTNAAGPVMVFSSNYLPPTAPRNQKRKVVLDSLSTEPHFHGNRRACVILSLLIN
jgi:hypothetical protein